MSALSNILTNIAAACTEGGSFFSFPTWYKYLPCEGDNSTIASFQLNHIWLILAAVLEMLLLLAGMMAVAYFIYGGFVLMTSQGSPERVSAGRSVMISATVGLVIVVMSAGIVQLIASALG